MRDVCVRYGIDVDRSGHARCPFHAERTGSMMVYGGSRGFHCFGCGAGGDVIDFVRRLFGLSFKEALDKLNSDFCLGLNLYSPVDKDALRRAHEQRQAALDDLTRRQAMYDALCREYRRISSLPLPTNDDQAESYAAAMVRKEQLDRFFSEVPFPRT